MSYTDARVGVEAVKQTVELKRIAEALERTAEAAEVANLLTILEGETVWPGVDYSCVLEDLRERLKVKDV